MSQNYLLWILIKIDIHILGFIVLIGNIKAFNGGKANMIWIIRLVGTANMLYLLF